MSPGPVCAVYGHLVFAADLSDPWAVFSIPTHDYDCRSLEGKLDAFASTLGALEGLGADFKLDRVQRAFDSDGYTRQLEQRLIAYPELGEEILAGHDAHLRALTPTTSELYLSVRLAAPRRDLLGVIAAATERDPRSWVRALRRNAGINDRKALAPGALEELRVAADHVHAKLCDFWLGARPITHLQAQWLIRRCFTRGLGEPVVDGLHEPAALVFERNGQALLAPQELELGRWLNSYIEPTPSALRIVSELGESWQAQLALGALPEQASAPGPELEVFFGRLENLGFAVDVGLHARYVPNDVAQRLVNRRIQDSDQIVKAEASGDRGVSDEGFGRTQDARDLLNHLKHTQRPPLLSSTVCLSVPARTREQLAERLVAVRNQFNGIAVHHPLGDQLDLFLSSFPAQACRVGHYATPLTGEQIAAMCPTAAHCIGPERSGVYIGHTLRRSAEAMRNARVVLFDHEQPSRINEASALLAVGPPGQGKSMLGQTLGLFGLAMGARVIHCDGKGDGRAQKHPALAGNVEALDMDSDRDAGLLDPMLNALPDARHDATVGWLADLVPHNAGAEWQTYILEAVDRVLAREIHPTCGDVITALTQMGDEATPCARHLQAASRRGFARLGIAEPGTADAHAVGLGHADYTYLGIRQLPRDANTGHANSLGRALMRLLGHLSMRLLAMEPDRLTYWLFSEAHLLLDDEIGRRLLGQLQRMGRSELAVPVLDTQLITDLMTDGESLDGLIGAALAFKPKTPDQAHRALTVLGLDPDDIPLRTRLMGLHAGQALMRDYEGRADFVQIDVVPRALFSHLRTDRDAAHRDTTRHAQLVA